MFKKEEVINFGPGSERAETIIGPSVRVEGDFSADGDVVVEGTVTGSLKTEKNLQVGPSAKIVANISAGSAQIAGEIQGNVKVRENLELTSTAKIFGEIKANALAVAAGAIINGKCAIGEDKKSKVEKIEKVAKHKEFDAAEPAS